MLSLTCIVLKWIHLFRAQIINTYTEAVQTVSIDQAVGKVHTLWTSFAKFYEEKGQLPEARMIFDKATKAPFRNVDDLATIWCEYAEMELRHEYVLTFCIQGL